jgi:hypothetical protein
MLMRCHAAFSSASSLVASLRRKAARLLPSDLRYWSSACRAFCRSGETLDVSWKW